MKGANEKREEGMATCFDCELTASFILQIASALPLHICRLLKNQAKMSIMCHLCNLHILVVQVQVIRWILLNHLREQNQQARDHAELIIVKSLLLHRYHLS